MLKTILVTFLILSFSVTAGWFDSKPKVTAKQIANRLNEQLPQDVKGGRVTLLSTSSEGNVVVYQVKHHKIYKDSAIIKLGSSNARRLMDVSVEEDRISTKRALCDSVQNQVIDQGISFRYELFDYKGQFFGEFVVDNCIEDLSKADARVRHKANKLLKSL